VAACRATPAELGAWAELLGVGCESYKFDLRQASGGLQAAAEEAGLEGGSVDARAGFLMGLHTTDFSSMMDEYGAPVSQDPSTWMTASALTLESLTSQQLSAVKDGAERAREEARAAYERAGGIVGTKETLEALKTRGDAIVESLSARAKRAEALLLKELTELKLEQGGLSRLIPHLRDLRNSLESGIGELGTQDGFTAARAAGLALDAHNDALKGEESDLARLEADVGSEAYKVRLLEACATATAREREATAARYQALLLSEREEREAILAAISRAGTERTRATSIEIEQAQASEFDATTALFNSRREQNIIAQGTLGRALQETSEAVDALRNMRRLQAGTRRLWACASLEGLASALGVPIRDEEAAEAQVAAEEAARAHPGAAQHAAKAGLSLSTSYWRAKVSKRRESVRVQASPVVSLGLSGVFGGGRSMDHATSSSSSATPHKKGKSGSSSHVTPVPTPKASALVNSLASFSPAFSAGTISAFPAVARSSSTLADGAVVPPSPPASAEESLTRAFKLSALNRGVSWSGGRQQPSNRKQRAKPDSQVEFTPLCALFCLPQYGLHPTIVTMPTFSPWPSRWVPVILTITSSEDSQCPQK